MQNPEDFDPLEWLGEDPDAFRATEEITVHVVDRELQAEMVAVRDKRQYYEGLLQEARKQKGEQSIAEGGTAVYEHRIREIETQQEELLSRLDGTAHTVTVVGLISPEIEEALKGLEGADPYDRTVALLAASCRIDGKRVLPSTLKRFHPAIGQGQWDRLIEAYNKVTHGDPWGGVTAPFSPRS